MGERGRAWARIGGGIVLVFVAAGFYATQCIPKFPRNPAWETTVTQAQPIIDALRAYTASHNGMGPASLDALRAAPSSERALSNSPNREWPLDPWEHPYVYEPGGPSLWSFGADGARGGYEHGASGDVLVWPEPKK